VRSNFHAEDNPPTRYATTAGHVRFWVCPRDYGGTSPPLGAPVRLRRDEVKSELVTGCGQIVTSGVLCDFGGMR
jgi:hypothetical protein